MSKPTYIANIGPSHHHWNHTSVRVQRVGDGVDFIRENGHGWDGVIIACDDKGLLFGRRYVSWASSDEMMRAGQAFCNAINARFAGATTD